MVYDTLRNIKGFIVYDVLHYGGERYGYIVRSVIAECHCEICLCISINEQDFLSLLYQTYAQIDRRGRFTNAAFLIGQGNHFAI